MLTRTCPQCGLEVSQSYTECPGCADAARPRYFATPPAPVRGPSQTGLLAVMFALVFVGTVSGVAGRLKNGSPVKPAPTVESPAGIRR